MHRWCLLNLTVQGFSLNLTVRGVSNKHCLLTFFHLYLHFALGIIHHGDRCDRKTPKTIILFK